MLWFSQRIFLCLCLWKWVQIVACSNTPNDISEYLTFLGFLSIMWKDATSGDPIVLLGDFSVTCAITVSPEGV